MVRRNRPFTVARNTNNRRVVRLTGPTNLFNQNNPARRNTRKVLKRNLTGSNKNVSNKNRNNFGTRKGFAFNNRSNNNNRGSNDFRRRKFRRKLKRKDETKSKDQMDMELDTYMGGDAMKTRLDADLANYFTEGPNEN